MNIWSSYLRRTAPADPGGFDPNQEFGPSAWGRWDSLGVIDTEGVLISRIESAQGASAAAFRSSGTARPEFISAVASADGIPYWRIGAGTSIGIISSDPAPVYGNAFRLYIAFRIDSSTVVNTGRSLMQQGLSPWFLRVEHSDALGMYLRANFGTWTGHDPLVEMNGDEWCLATINCGPGAGDDWIRINDRQTFAVPTTWNNIGSNGPFIPSSDMVSDWRMVFATDEAVTADVDTKMIDFCRSTYNLAF